MEISTSSIDHFGMIAGVFDELNISQIIDRVLPKTRRHKASHSAIVKAMVLNGLGFIESRLYFYSKFFHKSSYRDATRRRRYTISPE